MIVTDMVEVAKARYRISIDNEIAFVLYKGDLRLFGIETGAELSGEKYDEIIRQVLPKRAKLRLMNLLQTRDYTEKQAREKLAQGHYPPEAIDEALDYVKSYGYINDVTYCKKYLEDRILHKSKRKLKQELEQKGIGKDIFESCYKEVVSEGRVMDVMTSDQIECAQIERLLLKKKYDSENADYDAKQKMMQFLFRKGYSVQNIQKVMGEFDSFT